MILYILIASAFVGWFGLIIGLFIYATDAESIFAGILAVVVFILGIAFLMKSTADEERKHPCIKEEISMVYNPATKTVMPMKHCIERGIWVTK